MVTELTPGMVYKIEWDKITDAFLFRCSHMDNGRYHGQVLKEDMSVNYQAFVVLSPDMVITPISHTYCYHTFKEMPLFTTTYLKCNKCGETR